MNLASCQLLYPAERQPNQANAKNKKSRARMQPCTALNIFSFVRNDQLRLAAQLGCQAILSTKNYDVQFVICWKCKLVTHIDIWEGLEVKISEKRRPKF
jgi:hypothetical protein